MHQEYGHIILLHDAGGDTREPTVTALPRIIETLQREGYQFISLEKYLGMSRQTLMPPIKKGKEYYAMQANLSLAELIYQRLLNGVIPRLFGAWFHATCLHVRAYDTGEKS